MPVMPNLCSEHIYGVIKLDRVKQKRVIYRVGLVV